MTECLSSNTYHEKFSQKELFRFSIVSFLIHKTLFFVSVFSGSIDRESLRDSVSVFCVFLVRIFPHLE